MAHIVYVSAMSSASIRLPVDVLVTHLSHPLKYSYLNLVERVSIHIMFTIRCTGMRMPGPVVAQGKVF